jgi:transcription-repair coupling factor (superfamily II helicase)
MNTLQGSDVFALFSRWPSFQAYERAVSAGPWPVEVEGTHGALNAFLAAQAFRSAKGHLLVVIPSQEEAEHFLGDLEFSGIQARLFPWWQALPYRPCAPRSPVFSERSECLAALLGGPPSIIIATERAFLCPLPPPEEFRALVFGIRKGAEIDPESIAERLSSYGYLRVPRVSLRGEFALRGEVLDIWLPGDDEATRVVFDFERVEDIKKFEPLSQASSSRLESVIVYPLKEVIWDDARLAALGNNLSDDNLYPAKGAFLLEELRTKGEARGEEIFFPLAFEKPASVLDYLGEGSGVVFFDYERLKNQAEALNREFKGLYRKTRVENQGKGDCLGDVPPPERIMANFQALEGRAPRSIRFRSLKNPEEKRISFACDPARSFFGNIDYFKEELKNLLDAGYRAMVFAETDVQAERIRMMLKDCKVAVIPHGISAGFTIPELKLLIVHESEIFGRKKRVAKSLHHAKSAVIDTFVELNPGDYVVHVNYGIGRFLGIERMRIMGNDRDYIKLEYAGEETVFIPIEQVNLVQRYIGNEGNDPRLDKIGSKSWEGRKSRVKKSVEDLAERLIRLYSRRKAAKGFAFPVDSDWQTAFEAAFPYEETEDQLRVVEEIKKDMESPEPMDRMVCGDVGFGKTEVAVRACFKAVMGGKQVAFLAPTTILAEQHFENFQERFQKFPVRVAMLSRLVPPKEQKGVVARLEKGEYDILVGTHRILQRDIRFKDLGLLVVDEEQRFGVKDKERLKEMKANIDCLTLTATPIPRTLHMSLLKIRDMSTLTTPPSNRQPVQTIIEEYDGDKVAEAIRREVSRGGQVFYLHNRIESLDDASRQIMELVPEVMVESAHGQMSGEELENIMHRFIHGGFQVLVSTAIIENGIDIPNVNTIIIDRADMFGISQLYQLRGRVGRSDRTAFALLMYPKERALTELAMKRLQIISDFTELGSGFKIAMKDMEVRGAGNLLGGEQSGDIYSVGFDLYMKLLEDAVRKLSDEDWKPEEEAYLELEYSGYIPEDYIAMPMVKMEIYKKIAGIRNQDELDRVYSELEDRFGPVPEEVLSLLSLAEIRILCQRLSISSLRERQGLVQVEFSHVAAVSVDKLLRMMRESPDRVKLDPHRANVIVLKSGNIGLKEKSEFIREKLSALAKG